MDRFRPIFVLAGTAILIAVTVFAARPRPKISEDRELKEIDLAAWDCIDELAGTAKTGDGVERNQMKNRAVPSGPVQKLPVLDTAAFLQHVAAFDAQTKGERRKDLQAGLKHELESLEKQLVSFTGYLVIAYAGPPETTNCGSSDYHDWHLELFEQPLDHAPEIGDPTPIICEITPRTQNAIFGSSVRMQDLAAFIRAPDLSIEPTGHPARKIRVTGYLMWDDEHNGAADIGTTISKVTANGYHQPWRSTAWEVHPAIKIESLDPAGAPPAKPPSPAAPPATTKPAIAPQPTAPAPAPQQFVTITQPVKIKIAYGETVLQRGMRLPVVSQDKATVTVRYLDGTYAIPIASTDLQSAP